MTDHDQAQDGDGWTGAVRRSSDREIEAVSARKRRVVEASVRVAEVSAELNRRLA